MATTLETLISELSQHKPYQPLSQEQIDQQAQQRYQSVYDQKRLDAQQSYENSDAALARELSGLQKQYDAQRVNAAAQTRSAYSQADRHALSRGMQRSSYNESNLTGIRLAGDAAQREIDREQTDQEQQIGQKRTQLSSQLSQTIRQLNENQKNDELDYADELTAREYDRAVQSGGALRDLAMQLYVYQHQLEQEAAEQARWQAEFNARYGQSTASSGKKRASASTIQQTAAAAAASGGVLRNQRDMIR